MRPGLGTTNSAYNLKKYIYKKPISVIVTLVVGDERREFRDVLLVSSEKRISAADLRKYLLDCANGMADRASNARIVRTLLEDAGCDNGAIENCRIAVLENGLKISEEELSKTHISESLRVTLFVSEEITG